MIRCAHPNHPLAEFFIPTVVFGAQITHCGHNQPFFRTRHGDIKQPVAFRLLCNFDRLNRADMDGIVKIQMARLLKRLVARKITLDLDDGARTWLADEGYDPVFGARPLKRVIQNALQNPLAEMLLAGDVLDGDTIEVSAGADGLVIGDRIAATNRPKPDEATVH